MTTENYLQFLMDLKPGLSVLQGTITSYLVVTSAIGVTSMALVQTAKDQLPMRKWYQRWRICQWISEGLESGMKKVGPISGVSEKSVEQDLLRLAVDGDQKAFYALEIEKLCGQLNAAAQSALQAPAVNSGLLTVLASEADGVALRLVLVGPPAASDGTLLPATDPASIAYVAARASVGQQVQRAIDALQLSVSADWQVHLQQTALILSVVLAWLGTLSAPSLKVYGPFQQMLFVVFTGVLAGFLAPVARDLIAALQNLRS